MPQRLSDAADCGRHTECARYKQAKVSAIERELPGVCCAERDEQTPDGSRRAALRRGRNVDPACAVMLKHNLRLGTERLS